MHFGNYRFECRFDKDAQLPPYKGSTFRGVFGRALKQVVCALKRQACPDCLLKNQCLYVSTFEPELLTTAENKTKAVSPHPYVIQPAPNDRTFYPQGTAFDFTLLLFGPVNARLPYFIYAIDRMGQIGIGRKQNGTRGTYTLDYVP